MHQHSQVNKISQSFFLSGQQVFFFPSAPRRWLQGASFRDFVRQACGPSLFFYAEFRPSFIISFRTYATHMTCISVRRCGQHGSPCSSHARPIHVACAVCRASPCAAALSSALFRSTHPGALRQCWDPQRRSATSAPVVRGTPLHATPNHAEPPLVVRCGPNLIR